MDNMVISALIGVCGALLGVLLTSITQRLDKNNDFNKQLKLKKLEFEQSERLNRYKKLEDLYIEALVLVSSAICTTDLLELKCFQEQLQKQNTMIAAYASGNVFSQHSICLVYGDAYLQAAKLQVVQDPRFDFMDIDFKPRRMFCEAHSSLIFYISTDLKRGIGLFDTKDFQRIPPEDDMPLPMEPDDKKVL